MLKPVVSPWKDEFERLVKSATWSLQIASPYVGRGPCELIARHCLRPEKQEIALGLLTDLSRDNVLSRSTDAAALAKLCETLPQMEVRFLPRLHAKIYVVDDREAVVTSANLTDGGLSRNLEYGIHVTSPALVRQIASDFSRYAMLGSVVSLAQLKRLAQIADRLSDMVRENRTSLHTEYEHQLREVDHEVLHIRAEGMSAHAAFADTLLYVLRDSPMATTSIYNAVQHIHPDLCDDDIKLIVGGKEWSQAKWRHRVRHAQQHLKQQGLVDLRDGMWRLI